MFFQLHLHTNCSHIHIILRPVRIIHNILMCGLMCSLKCLFFSKYYGFSHCPIKGCRILSSLQKRRLDGHLLMLCLVVMLLLFLELWIVLLSLHAQEKMHQMRIYYCLKFTFCFQIQLPIILVLSFLWPLALTCLRTILGGAIASIIVFVFLYDNGPNNTIL